MELGPYRRLLRPLACLVVAPILLLVLVANGWGLLGLGGYVVIVFAVVVWNFAALFRATTNRYTSFRGLFAPWNLAVLLAYGFVFVVWGIYVLDLWAEDRMWYALGYAVAAAVAASAMLTEARTRRLRNHLILAYNIIGTLALGAWAAADQGSDGGLVLGAVAQGWGVVQTLLFTWGAYFAPIFFLPPLLLIEPRTEVAPSGTQESPDGPDPEGADGVSAQQKGRGPVRRLSSWGMDGALGAMVVLLVLFSVVGGGNIASWNDLPDPVDAVYAQRDDFEFAAVGRAFTDRGDPTATWRSVVDQEIQRAKDLGLDHIRYDLQRELLNNPDHLDKLDVAVGLIRDAGLDVMLSPFGSGGWEADHPTFMELVEEVGRETRVLVQRYEPAWVLPFFEPNGQTAVNLGRMADVEDWVAVIDALAREVHAMSNRTRVLIEVAMEPEQGLELVEALSDDGLAIDALGVDLYPMSADVLDDLDDYRRRATNPDLGFWISEFGVESVLSGRVGQARALSSVLARATGELNGTGICVWSLLDDTVLPSNLGIVGRDGGPKAAYGVLKEAIEQVRGG